MDDLGKLEDSAAAALAKLEKKYEREVQAALNDALVKMRGDMARLYSKYARDGELTKAEMTRYNRYASMESQMLADLDPAIKANLKTIKRLTPEQYQAAFFRYAWAVDNAAGIRIAWGILNIGAIVENLANEFAKISIDRYGLEARLAVRSALNDGLALGKSYQKMARDLKNALNTTYWRALRIIRTEGQTAVSAGQDDAYIKAMAKGVSGEIVWDATLDIRTRQTHGAMDGSKKKADGTFDGPGGERARYPGDANLSAGERINCRCRERFVISGYEPSLRRTRDAGVIPYQTYEEWAKTNGPKVR